MNRKLTTEEQNHLNQMINAFISNVLFCVYPPALNYNVQQHSAVTDPIVSFWELPERLSMSKIERLSIRDIIIEIYSKMQETFMQNRDSILITPLVKLMIIKFLKYTEKAQYVLKSQQNYADRFVSLLPTSKWIRPLSFRAISSVLPTINEKVRSLNPTIRPDILFVMQAVESLNSSDRELFESAKEVLQNVGKKIVSLQFIYLHVIKMPFLLIFLPDMIQDSDLVLQVISQYASLMDNFIQRILNQDKEEETDVVDDVPEKNKSEYNFYHQDPIIFLHDVFLSIIQFVKNLKEFPKNLFAQIFALGAQIFDSCSSQEDFLFDEQGQEMQVFILIFEMFSEVSHYLGPYNQDIADFAIGFIMKLPIARKETDEGQTIGEIDFDRNYLILPLKLLSKLQVTDARLRDVPPIDNDSAALLISLFPHPQKNDNPGDADQIINIMLPFQNQNFTIETCKLFLTQLPDFIPYLSEEAHSIILESILPNLTKQDPKHQELIAELISSIPLTAENNKLLSYYIYFASSTYPRDVPVCPKLKAVCMSLFYLANSQPEPPFAAVNANDIYECAEALFLIGEYDQPAVFWETISSETSQFSKDKVKASKAFHHLSLAEKYYNMMDHSKSAREFMRAAEAFRMTDFPHDLHVFYSRARYCFESICMQVELMNTMYFDPSAKSGPISQWITDIEELQMYLPLLRNSSLLLHPRNDRVSRSYIQNFIAISEEMIRAINSSPTDFSNVIENSKILPPPAILSTQQPLTIEDLKITNPEIEIKDPINGQLFYLEVSGRVVRNEIINNDVDYFDKFCFCSSEPKGKNLSLDTKNDSYDWMSDSNMKLRCAIESRGEGMKLHSEGIPTSGEFKIDFPIKALPRPLCPEGCRSDSAHNMIVTFSFVASFPEDGFEQQYLISIFDKYVKVNTPYA